MFKIIKPNGEVYKEDFDTEDEAHEAIEAYYGLYAYSLGYTIKQIKEGV